MPPDPPKSSPLQSLVGVQSLMQLGFVLPVTVLVGWAAGLGLDHWLHQHWINIAGLIVGAVAGFVQIFRVVLAHTKE